jgi:hypothetical protein
MTDKKRKIPPATPNAPPDDPTAIKSIPMIERWAMDDSIGELLLPEDALAIEDRGERIDRMLIEVENRVPKHLSRTIQSEADSVLWDKMVAEGEIERAGLNRPFDFGNDNVLRDEDF